MTSRERFIKAINHIETDRPPIDVGSTSTTGISAYALHFLRKKLGIDLPVKIEEPFQILGKVEEEDRQALGVDIMGVFDRNTFFGNKNNGKYQPWNFRGVDMLIGEDFRYTTAENGDVFAYPKGNLNVKPSGKLPSGGYYFDGIVRSDPVDEDNLTPVEDYKEQYCLMNDEDLLYIQKQADHIYTNTEYGAIFNWGGGALGDVAHLPGTALENPVGLRDIEEWYMFHILHPEYMEELFDYQVEIAIENLKLIKEALGDKIQAIFVSGTDFGTQIDTIMSLDTFKEIYKPRYKKINNWIHENTNWKTFYHSCGAIKNFIPEFIDMGVDILNPVQCSATGMDAQELKDKFGKDIVFWGGGVDTQKTLPFGTPEEVYEETKERVKIFSKDGGFVFNSIHNIQANSSPENLLAFFKAGRCE